MAKGTVYDIKLNVLYSETPVAPVIAPIQYQMFLGVCRFILGGFQTGQVQKGVGLSSFYPIA